MTVPCERLITSPISFASSSSRRRRLKEIQEMQEMLDAYSAAMYNENGNGNNGMVDHDEAERRRLQISSAATAPGA